MLADVVFDLPCYGERRLVWIGTIRLSNPRTTFCVAKSLGVGEQLNVTVFFYLTVGAEVLPIVRGHKLSPRHAWIRRIYETERPAIGQTVTKRNNSIKGL